MSDDIELSAAPVAVKVDSQWHVDDGQHSTLIYSLMEDGWRKGEPVMINDVMIRVEKSHKSKAEIQPIVEAILSALSPAPASEPVAWAEFYDGKIVSVSIYRNSHHQTPLFTSPPSTERLREAAKAVIAAEASWRECMPKDWEGDPLTDAIADLSAALADQKGGAA